MIVSAEKTKYNGNSQRSNPIAVDDKPGITNQGLKRTERNRCSKQVIRKTEQRSRNKEQDAVPPAAAGGVSSSIKITWLNYKQKGNRMGYYTDFSLSVRGVSGRSICDEEKKRIEERINRLEVFEWHSSFDSWVGNAKWYEHTEDMTSISKDFPGVLFVLDGTGESSDDIWIEYFCEGRTQRCEAIISYERPDMNYLTGCDNIDVDENSQIDEMLECL